jgi:ribosomal protein L17
VTSSSHYEMPAADHRTQAVFDQVAASLEQMDIDHTLRQAITEQIFDSSRVAMLRAIHSADFIHRLIEVTPSLSEQQHRELRGIADDLIQLARQAPQDAHERGKLQQQEPRDSQRKADALDGVVRDVQAEWEGLKEEWASMTRWLRK